MNVTKSLLTTSIAATVFTALLAAPAVARSACTDGGCAEYVAVAAATGTSPYAEPLDGHDAIRDFWVDDDDDGSVFRMQAWPVAAEGTDAVVRVMVEYGDPVDQEYLDLWVLRFADDGRVEHFEEWAYWPDKAYTIGSPAD